MKLAQWIEKLPRERWEAFLSPQATGNDPRSGEDDLSALRDRLVSVEHLYRFADTSRPWVRKVLETAVSRFGLLPFELRDLERTALPEGISGAHVRAALRLMRKQGIVLPLRKSWGEELFVLPEETFALWSRLLFPGGLEGPSSGSGEAEGAEELIGSAGCAAYDVMVLLDFLQSEKVRPTKTGGWPKPALKKLMSRFIVRNEDLAPLSIRMETGFESFEPAAAVILDLAIRSGLVMQCKKRWAANPAALRDWLEQSVPLTQRMLYRLFTEVLTGAESWETHALNRMGEAQPGRWYMLAHLFEWLRDCGMIKRISDSHLTDFMQTRLLPMQALGWIQLSKTAGGGFAFRVPFPLAEPAGPESTPYGGILVQPDLELVLPPYPPLSLLWVCMSWCETVSRGEMFVFRLTRERALTALGRGFQAEDWIRTLERWNVGPVDPQVVAVVREWADVPAAAPNHMPDGTESGEEWDNPTPILARIRSEPECIPSPGQPEPSWNGVPPAWVQRLDAYHPSTRKEIIRRSIEWNTPLRLDGTAEGELEIIPLILRESGAEWSVEGQAGRNRIMVRPEEWNRMQIIIPGVRE